MRARETQTRDRPTDALRAQFDRLWNRQGHRCIEKSEREREKKNLGAIEKLKDRERKQTFSKETNWKITDLPQP